MWSSALWCVRSVNVLPSWLRLCLTNLSHTRTSENHEDTYSRPTESLHYVNTVSFSTCQCRLLLFSACLNFLGLRPFQDPLVFPTASTPFACVRVCARSNWSLPTSFVTFSLLLNFSEPKFSVNNMGMMKCTSQWCGLSNLPYIKCFEGCLAHILNAI